MRGCGVKSVTTFARIPPLERGATPFLCAFFTAFLTIGLSGDSCALPRVSRISWDLRDCHRGLLPSEATVVDGT